MTEEELKEKMDKDLDEIFNVKSIIDFQFDLMKKSYTKGLETGFKAGRPQWHDLRKDPNDLPDEGTYLVVWQNASGYKETMLMNYEEDDEEKLHWFDDEQDCWDNDVIAWCEIPAFDKE